MPRSRWQAFRLLLVCALLALSSAAPRAGGGWFETVVLIAHAAESAASVEQATPTPRAAQTQAPRPAAPRIEASAAPAGVRVARPNARLVVVVSHLYLVNRALLC